MNEITFQDALTHYGLKLKEVSDELETLKIQIKKAEDFIDMGWHGLSANACRVKLESIKTELQKTSTEISEALVRLTTIVETVETENTIMV